MSLYWNDTWYRWVGMDAQNSTHAILSSILSTIGRASYGRCDDFEWQKNVCFDILWVSIHVFEWHTCMWLVVRNKHWNGTWYNDYQMGAWNSKDIILSSAVDAIGRATEDVMIQNKNWKTIHFDISKLLHLNFGYDDTWNNNPRHLQLLSRWKQSSIWSNSQICI